MTTAVACSDLVVRYGERTAVDGVSFTVDHDEVLCVLGPNGAGKTSILECLEGYRRPAAGSLRVLGLDPRTDHSAVVGRIGVMLQRGGVYPMLSARQALRLFCAYYPDPEDPEDLLELVRLRAVARTPWRHLSGGEQARLSLALALVGRPEVVFLDEPTAGVDPEGRLSVREVIRGLRERATCVVLTTHEMPEAERLADRVVILQRGRIIAQGSPAALMSPSGSQVEVSFGASPGLALETLVSALGPGASVVETAPGRYRAARGPAAGAGHSGAGDGDGAAAVAATVTAWLAGKGVGFSDLRVGRTLEEAYLEVVGTATGAEETATDAEEAATGDEETGASEQAGGGADR